MIQRLLRCPSIGQKVVMFPLGFPTSGQNVIKCPLRCLSGRQNTIKCLTTFCVLVPHRIQQVPFFTIFAPAPQTSWVHHCLCVISEHRLGSSRLWTHLTVGGSEWSAVGVSCHPICPPLWWNQLLGGSGRWQQTAELPGAFKWWKYAERQSQQVTWQVISQRKTKSSLHIRHVQIFSTLTQRLVPLFPSLVNWCCCSRFYSTEDSLVMIWFQNAASAQSLQY